MLYFIQTIIIKIFQLTDLTDMLLKAKQSQLKKDKEHYEKLIEDERNILNRKHALDIQEKDSEIIMLQQQIDSYRDREKEVANKEFQAKKQIKENSFVMRYASDNLKEFAETINGIYGKMDKIKDTVDKQKKAIEEK
jgi:chromosome segregation ATPase